MTHTGNYGGNWEIVMLRMKKVHIEIPLIAQASPLYQSFSSEDIQKCWEVYSTHFQNNAPYSSDLKVCPNDNWFPFYLYADMFLVGTDVKL